jgi:hypothetical protein
MLISTRQTTFWDFIDREGRARVHFKDKSESHFVQPEVPSFQILDEHPLLLNYLAPWQGVFVSQPAPDSALVVEELTRAINSITSGWRPASAYLNAGYAHAVMEEGAGLLLRAPLPIVEAAKVILDRSSVRFSTLPFQGPDATRRVLVAGENWVVAKAFRVERLPPGGEPEDSERPAEKRDA